MYNVAVDVGGTFTDSVAISDDGLVFRSARYIGKAPTVPNNLADGVMNSLRDLASQIGISIERMLRETRFIGHGTTQGTNALLTRRGATIGLITTRGFEDTVHIQRAIGRMAGLPEVEVKHQVVVRSPEPLLSKDFIKGVTERTDCFGEIIFPLDEDEVREVVRELLDKGVQAMAVCLLWSFANNTHERAIKRILEEMAPGMPVSLSSELAPKLRENARTNTVVINAYIDTVVKGYMADLNARVQKLGYGPNIAAMQVFGGVTDSSQVSSIHTIDSGPVGGVIGAKFFADLLGYENVITTDVGGTSFDVSVLYQGRELIAREYFGAPGVIYRFETLVPRVDIRSIGAGGGTIAWLDETTRTVKLGPRSAGAVPGPVFYDAGGTEPTVSDACMVLGYLNPDYFLGGKVKTNKAKAVTAIKEKLADPLNLSVEKVAAGIFDIANHHMSDAIRACIVEKGYDPSNFVAFGFGGAGPVHASSYGEITGVKKTIILETATAFSALGIAMSDIVHKRSVSLIMQEPFRAREINEAFQTLEQQARDDFAKEGLETLDITLERSVEMRYRGQIHELTIPVPRKDWRDEEITGELKRIFVKRYEEVYGKGSSYTAGGIEIVAVNVDGIGITAKPEFGIENEEGPDPSSALKGYREAYFSKLGGFVKTAVYDSERIRHGNRLTGPAIVEAPQTTVVILPGQTARVDGYRNIVIDHR